MPMRPVIELVQKTEVCRLLPAASIAVPLTQVPVKSPSTPTTTELI